MHLVCREHVQLTKLLISRILLELQGNDEPLWTYFDSQHKHIMEQMNKAYRAAKAVVQGNSIAAHFVTCSLTFHGSRVGQVEDGERRPHVNVGDTASDCHPCLGKQTA